MANEQNLKPFSSNYQPKKNGRKKGHKNFKTIYKKFLNQKFKKSELEEITGFEIPFSEEREMTVQEAIVLRHLKKALGKADYKDIEMIINRVEGLLKQEIKHSGTITEVIREISDEELDKRINELES